MTQTLLARWAAGSAGDSAAVQYTSTSSLQLLFRIECATLSAAGCTSCKLVSSAPVCMTDL